MSALSTTTGAKPALQIEDLGTLRDDDSGTSRAEQIATDGVTVGRSQIEGSGATHGVRWDRDGSTTEIGTFRSGDAGSSFANDVNPRETIAGTATDTNESRSRSGGRLLACRYTDRDGLERLGTLDDTPHLDSRAFGINRRGTIVGESRTAEFDAHGFRWTERAGMVDLGTLRDDDSGASPAYGVNARGTVVGKSSTDSRSTHAYEWTAKDGMVDLGTLPDHDVSVAFAVNDGGVVVGYSTVDGDLSSKRAVRWVDGEIESLGTIGDGDDEYSEARDVNDRGEVVGWNNAGPNEAFRWDDGIEGLGFLDDGTGRSSRAFGVDDRGQIVGDSTASSGADHAVRWE